MVKKIFLLICALIIQISMISCGTEDNKNQNFDYNNIRIKVFDVKDLNIIANDIFTEYLNSFTKDTADNNRKLKNYKINKIEIRNESSSSFEFFADYSVQPVNIDAWLIANGELSGDWVNNQNLFVEVNINNDVYSIEKMGTSPIDVP